MKTGRDKKVAEEIRREISQIFSFELGDPRLNGVMVTGVRMTPDLKLARVYFALPSRPEGAQAAGVALKKCAGFIRHKIAERILIKYMPQLEFFYDESLELETRLDEIFKKLPERPSDVPQEDESE